MFGVYALDMCLVPDVVIPPKFKVYDFKKYKGLDCPKNHLRNFSRKMVAYAYDEKMLIHYFKDNLSGTSLKWYMQLEKAHICTWEDITNAFLRQYKYNLEMDPNCMQLYYFTQKNHEYFKEYAQSWREMASRVQPTLLERELVDIFMCNLPSQYYERIIGRVSSGFYDLVIIGERIEDGLKSGKIQGVSSRQTSADKFSNFNLKNKVIPMR